MTENTAPIRYMLYSHYAYREDPDFDAYQHGKDVKDLDGLNNLLSYSRGLGELLTTPGHEGLLVLFYSPGYLRFLEALAAAQDIGRLLTDSPDDPEMKREIRRMQFAKDAAVYVRGKLELAGLSDRVRFLTWFDLTVILGRANAILAAQFERFFIGRTGGIRYDAPKVVEAILRLRLLGSGVPVLRVDHDVLFRNANQNIGDLGMFKAIACSMRAYQLRLAEPTVSTFLFSASYNSRELLYPTEAMDRFEAWSRAFATRIYPALTADVGEIRRICSSPNDQRNPQWDQYVIDNLDETLVRRFFGLTPEKGKLEPDGISGLAEIGAHPLYSVISGALLCLSEGAILDLPPFSNMGMNVMWIDDHLKYSLHRAMGHFTSSETLDLGPGLSNARMGEVTVTKARPPVSNLPAYIFGIYLPTLFFGTIMDAWITKDPILKAPIDTLQPKEKVEWRIATDEQNTAPLPRALLESLRIGDLDSRSADELRRILEQYAVLRIEKTRQIWASLKTDNKRTFASYWAAGDVEAVFGHEIFTSVEKTLWQGISPGKPLTKPITSLDHLTARMALAVYALIDDTVDYVRWALGWPGFVQIVRSIHQGNFAGDLSWTPK